MVPRSIHPESAAKVLEFLIGHGKNEVAVRLSQVLTDTFSEGPFAHYLSFLALFHAKRFEDAAASIRRACDLAPLEPSLKSHLFRAMRALGRADESEALIRAELARHPGWTEFKLDLARSLGDQGKYDEAEGVIQELLKTDPNNAVYRHQLSWYLMHRGRLREGQKLSVGLRPLHLWGARSLPLKEPIWDGGDPKHRRICLIGEGGLGDEIIGARFGKLLHERGATVMIACNAELVNVFKRVGFFSEVVSFGELNRLRFDSWIPCLDACALLGLEYHELPREPFLSADTRSREKWRARLARGKLRVGIRWQGSREFEGEQMRRVPAELMFDWAKLDGVQLYSLQKPLEQPLPASIIDLGSDLETWDDTLGALAELDLVITTCSSVAHAAGALGRPTWVVAPAMPYYTWAEPGEKSSWYPSVRVFRQTRFRHWEEPCGAITAELKRLS